MIEGLKPYAEYKESGQKWLGSIPAHWNVRRTKLLLREVDSRSSTGKEQLLRVSQYTGVTQRKASDGSDAPDTRAASLVGYKRVSANDLVINIMLAWNGSLGASRYDGIASPAYCVYRFRQGALPWYYHELFRLPLYKGRIKTASTGVVESRLRLYSDDLGRIESLLPPSDEQDAIVRFLDHANRKIDGFIRAKRKLIGLLNEQKQAIIHRAVTRGLNPDAPLKPSGVPWLGDIPAYWEVQRLGRIARVFNGSTPSRNKPSYWRDGTIPWLPSGKVNDHIVRSASEFVTHEALRECSISIVPKGAVIIGLVGQGKTRGKSALIAIDACINQNLAAIIPRPCLDSAYLLAFLTAFYHEVREFGRGGNQEALNCEIVANLRISMPPLDEQRQLVSSIAFETRDINTAITRTEREIALMQEYLTRLTADIVTGKLDVREAAAKLPDLPTDPAVEPLVDDALDDTETEDAEA